MGEGGAQVGGTPAEEARNAKIDDLTSASPAAAATAPTAACATAAVTAAAEENEKTTECGTGLLFILTLGLCRLAPGRRVVCVPVAF